MSDSVNSDCNPPSSSVHGIFQARILERAAISYSRGSSQPRNWTHIPCISPICRQNLYHWCHLGTIVRKASFVLIWMNKEMKRFSWVLQVQQVMVFGCEVKNNLISLTFGKRVTHTSLSCFITKDQIVCSNICVTIVCSGLFHLSPWCAFSLKTGPETQRKESATALKSQLMFRAAQALETFLSSHRCPFSYFTNLILHSLCLPFFPSFLPFGQEVAL